MLNLTNLKKLVLGKQRYIREDLVNDTETAQSKVYDSAISDLVLQTLHELNPEFVVERYNKHYSTLSSADFIVEKGLSVLPEYSYINLSGMTFTSSPEDASNYHSYLEYLTDNNDNTSWEPAGAKELTTYTLTLNLKTTNRMYWQTVTV